MDYADPDRGSSRSGDNHHNMSNVTAGNNSPTHGIGRQGLLSNQNQSILVASSNEYTPSLSSSARPLVALVPLPVLPLGTLEIDDEQSCVVYSAPIATFAMERLLLTQQIKEKHTRKLAAGSAPSSPVKLTALPSPSAPRVINLYTGGQGPGFGGSLSPPNGRLPSLTTPRENESEQVESSEQPATAIVGDAAASTSEESPQMTKTSPRNNDSLMDSNDFSLVKLKQRVRFLPLKEEDKRAFWEQMERTLEAKRILNQAIMNNDKSPIVFNREAACDKTLLDERHENWVDQHHARLVLTRENKLVEDAKYIQRMIEASSDYRNQLRELRRQLEERNILCQALLPVIFLMAFTGKMMDMLQTEWTRRRRMFYLQKFLHLWTRERKKRSSTEKSALVLIYWLQKCVTLRSVGFRVFAALRLYLRKVKRVQQLWRVRCARRRRRIQYLDELWVAHETKLVDAAAEEFEKQQQLNRERGGGRRQKKIKQMVEDPGVALTLVPEGIRSRIIRDFLIQREKETIEKMRQLEMEYFPQLVQTLRCEYPDKSRGYIRERAKNCALLGRVVSTLRRIPNALQHGVLPPAETFWIDEATLQELVRQGREEFARQEK